MSTSQRAMMPCGWEVKAGMVCEWMAGKTVWSPYYHGPYLSALAVGYLIIGRAIQVYNYYTLLTSPFIKLAAQKHWCEHCTRGV